MSGWKKLGILGVGLLTIAAGWAIAEVPPRSPEDLQSESTDIISGTVNAIYSREVKDREITKTHYAAEITVSKTEKGDLKPGDLIYIRYWRMTGHPPGWVGPSGAWNAPKEGDGVLVFLSKAQDGGFDVLQPNGFSK